MSLAAVFTTFSSLRSSHSSVQYAEAGSRTATDDSKKTDEDSVELNGKPSSASETYAPSASAVAPLEGASGRTDAANNILNFIAGRLRVDVAEGATADELVSRLEAGLQGFIKGYQEAYEQLAGMGFLTGDVQSAIEKTFDDVLGGIDALASELGVASPVSDDLREQAAQRRSEYVPPEVSEDSTNAVVVDVINGGAGLSANKEADSLRELITASTYNYREEQSRSFNFSLKTQDGDEVTIKAAYASSSVLDGEQVNYGGEQGTSVNSSFQASNGFYLSVEGELDEAEVLAIEGLLSQIRDVSNTFFSGDVEKAYEYALGIGFDSDEIAQFSLKLRYQYSASVEETYKQVSNNSEVPVAGSEKVNALNGKDDQVMLLARFVQSLENMRVSASELGLKNFSELLQPLGNTQGSEKDGALGVVQDMLQRLESLAAA